MEYNRGKFYCRSYNYRCISANKLYGHDNACSSKIEKCAVVYRDRNNYRTLFVKEVMLVGAAGNYDANAVIVNWNPVA